MSFAKLILRSVFFWWRTSLGVFLGVLLGGSILVGALAVGDSVRWTLRWMALSRLGEVNLAATTGGRFVREALARELSVLLGVKTAGVILLKGSAVNEQGTARVNGIQVVGVDRDFWDLGGAKPVKLGENRVALNSYLADRLGVKQGDTVLLRVERPGVLPKEAPLSGEEDFAVSRRLEVVAVLGPERFGRFGLKASQIPPSTAFLDRSFLAELIGKQGRANAILVGGGSSGPSLEHAHKILQGTVRLADLGVEVCKLPELGVIEVRSDRVFLQEEVVQAARKVAGGAVGVLTYLANEIRRKDRATPYAIVSAVGGIGGPAGAVPPCSRGVPCDLKGDQIVLTDWVAEDIAAGVGDQVQLRYYVVGAGKHLQERTAQFTVSGIVPVERIRDPSLLPPFPGLADVENCKDWKPGVPIDLSRIRRKDELYWDRYRGTPKAFISLETGRRLWANRFGSLTALRYSSEKVSLQALSRSLREALDCRAFGLFFRPVRRQALAASAQALDFGQLFLGLSFFLIISALLLVGLLFLLGVERRSAEIGTLLAVGFGKRQVGRVLFGEGTLIGALGSVLGCGGGVLYGMVLLRALATWWRGAMGTGELRFNITGQSLLTGAAATFAMATFAIFFALRRATARQVRELLSGRLGMSWRRPGRAVLAAVSGSVLCLAALALVAAALGGSTRSQVALFFSSGAMLLIGGLALVYAFFLYLAGLSRETRLSFGALALRNVVRRRGRSLAVVALLACGTFLVIAVGANRHDPRRNSSLPSSGTGGFELFGDSVFEVPEDLNSPSGYKSYGLSEGDLEGVSIVSLRVKEGEDASCLNLNRVTQVQLLGVRPEQLAARGSFTFVRVVEGAPRNWSVLERREEGDIVPAVGDEPTVVWGLGKKVGDLIPYVDEKGRAFSIRIVAIIARSVFQGSLLISERDFLERFPSVGGYRVFLVDIEGGPERVAACRSKLTQALNRAGLALEPAWKRLARFNVVEETYLTIFLALGILGMLLGSVGLGIVVLRNALERRAELALLEAVGFLRRNLLRLLLWEHGFLVLLGVGTGFVAAIVAVFPAVVAPGGDTDLWTVVWAVLILLGGGFVWTLVACSAALHGRLVDALRNE